MSYVERISHADDLLANPDSLVAEFSKSVSIFAAYNNRECFYSNRMRSPKAPPHIGALTRTHHVAWYLRQKPVLNVIDAPSLSAEYVDYEIAPARTTGGAHFDDDGGSWRSGVFIDLILANLDDRTPIIAELKIANDKDPFTALLQVLAGVVHCVSAKQQERLRICLKGGRFPATDDYPVDAYILLHRFLETAQADLQTLEERAKELSGRLMEYPDVTVRLRRLVCLNIELDPVDFTISGKCRWPKVAERASSSN